MVEGNANQSGLNQTTQTVIILLTLAVGIFSGGHYFSGVISDNADKATVDLKASVEKLNTSLQYTREELVAARAALDATRDSLLDVNKRVERVEDQILVWLKDAEKARAKNYSSLLLKIEENTSLLEKVNPASIEYK